jgi:hypothetical protein
MDEQTSKPTTDTATATANAANNPHGDQGANNPHWDQGVGFCTVRDDSKLASLSSQQKLILRPEASNVVAPPKYT